MMQKVAKKVEIYKYYIVIAILSLIVVFFMPFIGSGVGLALNIPNTFVGWSIYILTKLLVVAINLTIFYSFMEQAKINIKDHPKYIEANTILEKYFKEFRPIPLGPEEWTKKQYKSKGISLAVTTLFGAIALTNAVLTFDFVVMLTYLFTIIMGIIFGFIQMGSAENYWTGEYWEYAIYIRDQKEHKQEDSDISVNSRTDILESDNSMCDTSPTDKSVFLDSGSGMGGNMVRTVHTSHSTTDRSSFGATETL